MKKDKVEQGISFHNRSTCQHDGYSTKLSNETQSKAMEFVTNSINELSYKLKALGYDHQTIRFSIAEKP